MSFINYLINGVSLGSVYAIIALGYTMVYGIAKMLNFAHGDIIMIGKLCCVRHSQLHGASACVRRPAGSSSMHIVRCCH